jgi:hypothetical protein
MVELHQLLKGNFEEKLMADILGYRIVAGEASRETMSQ